MTDAPLHGASWISRPVPAAQRIVRATERAGIDWAEPGHRLAQTFRSEGPVVAVSIDLAGPRDAADPFAVDVRYAVTLEGADGTTVAEKVFEGPQLVWDYFGALLEVTPPAPPGEYAVTLRAEREAIGWYRAEPPAERVDDGVSPVPLEGRALRDGEPAMGLRTVGVDTVPAANPVFRREFELGRVPAAATLAATVLGTGVIRVNGRRVGDEALEPAVTDYDRTVLFRRWEVAHLLRAGTNEITIEAGRERWAARGGDVWGWHLAPWHREPVAIARLAMGDADGASHDLVTDATWLCAAGPVEVDQLFRGERWVVRAEEPVWDPAAVVAPPRGVLRESDLPPVRPGPPRPPASSVRLPSGARVFDFGQAMVGRVRCRVTGSPGAYVRVLSGEQRADDGRVVCDNDLVAGDAQVDVLRLEADVADLEWEPQFGYRGFRWMQVETSGDVTVDQVQAVPLYTQVDRMGWLTTSDPVLQWIDAATARTFLNNLHGIPTDTPIYEKNGWTADAHLATEGLLHHFDLRASFGKWVRDHADSQSPDGAIPQIVPTPGWGRASDPAWSASAVLIPWYLYREYGDLDLLAESAAMVRRFAEDVERRLEGGLWRHRTWGDWLAPGHMVPPEGMAPIGTMMAVTVLQHTALVLRELGDDGAQRLSEAAARTATAYHDVYFDPERGHYAVDGVGYRQSLNVLPLAFDAVPAEHVASVRASLVRDLEERTGGHLDCGAVALRHLLPVLSAAGRDDLAVTVLTRRNRPGWGAWFEAGESTLLEAWDADARSRNHYFLGSVSSWIQQRIGGLRLVEPGWRRFEVAPVEDPRVTGAAIRHVTPLGPAAVSWQHGPGGWLVDVEVPSGATARLAVAGTVRELGAGRHRERVTA